MIVEVIGTTSEISPEEKQAYIDYVQAKFPGREISQIVLKIDGDYVDIHWTLKELPPFERIRRITGYLVGTLDRWNNGKLAEEHDRVKHGVDDS